MNITIDLNVHLPDLAAFVALAGGKLPTVASTTTAGPSAAASAKAEDAKEVPKSADKAAKKPAAKAATSANEDAAAKEQTEIDGNTNAGCLIMIKRVAAMDGKDEKGNDKITGVNKARAIIQGFGGIKVSELPKDKWADFIEECQKTLDAKGEPAAAGKVEEMF